MQLPNQARPIQRKKNFSVRNKSLNIQMSDDDMDENVDDEDEDGDMEGGDEGGDDAE